jgi:hypothetical protein
MSMLFQFIDMTPATCSQRQHVTAVMSPNRPRADGCAAGGGSGISNEALVTAFTTVKLGPVALYVGGFALVMKARAERLAAALSPLRATH